MARPKWKAIAVKAKTKRKVNAVKPSAAEKPDYSTFGNNYRTPGLFGVFFEHAQPRQA
jgi:hypothetical protein